jgi:hypothetical protein
MTRKQFKSASSISLIAALIMILQACATSSPKVIQEPVIQNDNTVIPEISQPTEISETRDTATNINQHFIIHLRKEVVLCKEEAGRVQEIRRLPITNESKSKVVNDEFICVVDSVVSIFDLNGTLLKKISSEFKPVSLHSKNRVVYLGGKSTENRENPGEIFALLDLNNAHFELNKVILPIEITNGKAIDDVLIQNNKLILVDNFIFPKYILEYDITNDNEPVHVSTKELPNNGTYEHIIKGDVNEHYMVLFSSCYGSYGSSKYIVVEGKSSGRLHFVEPWDERKKENLGDKVGKRNFDDFCLIDSNLHVVANGLLFSLDLNGTVSDEYLNVQKTTIQGVKRVMTTPSNKLVVINENEYEIKN